MEDRYLAVRDSGQGSFPSDMRLTVVLAYSWKGAFGCRGLKDEDSMQGKDLDLAHTNGATPPAQTLAITWHARAGPKEFLWGSSVSPCACEFGQRQAH